MEQQSSTLPINDGRWCPRCGVFYVAMHTCAWSTVLQQAPGCDHCYCAEPLYSYEHDEPHKRCCKCSDVRAVRFISNEGR